MYVCPYLYIYIFKETQVYTDGLFSVKSPLSPVEKNDYKSMESCQLVQFNLQLLFSPACKIIHLFFNS